MSQPNTVRELVKSAGDAARRLKVSKSAVYRWIRVNRIPGMHLIKLSTYYGYDPKTLIHLTGSEKTNETKVVIKPRTVLAAMMSVFREETTLEEAAKATGQSKISLCLIQRRWGDRLPTLYTTLEQLDQGRITSREAAERLKVSNSTMYGIRRKYGYSPGPLPAKKQKEPKPDTSEIRKKAVIGCISGEIKIKQAAKDAGVCERTILREIDKLCPVKIRQLNRMSKEERAVFVEKIK